MCHTVRQISDSSKAVSIQRRYARSSRQRSCSPDDNAAAQRSAFGRRRKRSLEFLSNRAALNSCRHSIRACCWCLRPYTSSKYTVQEMLVTFENFRINACVTAPGKQWKLTARRMQYRHLPPIHESSGANIAHPTASHLYACRTDRPTDGTEGTLKLENPPSGKQGECPPVTDADACCRGRLSEIPPPPLGDATADDDGRISDRLDAAVDTRLLQHKRNQQSSYSCRCINLHKRRELNERSTAHSHIHTRLSFRNVLLTVENYRFSGRDRFQPPHRYCR
jgi:hypothetical protein